MIPGSSGRSPGEGNGNPLQYSCLENPMDGGAWWATVHGVTRSQTRLSDFTSLHPLLAHIYKNNTRPCRKLDQCINAQEKKIRYFGYTLSIFLQNRLLMCFDKLCFFFSIKILCKYFSQLLKVLMTAQKAS